MKNPFARKKSDFESYDEDFDRDFYHGEEDEEEGVVDDFKEEQPAAPAPKRPTQSAATGNLLQLVTPHNYDEGPIIAEYLMDGYTVVMNIEEIDKDKAMRLIDFLLGALKVLGGECKRLTKTTLVMSPRSGEVVDAERGRQAPRGEADT